MLVATFGPSTGWSGKTITYENNAFVLEDHGIVDAATVMEYGRQGQIAWATDGTRAWVGARAQASPPRSTDQKIETAFQKALVTTGERRTVGQQAAGIIGLFLVVCGLGAAVYFFLAFDTSVEVPVTDLGNGLTVGGQWVNNIGLMADRQNGILVGFGFAAVGGVLMFIGRMRKTAASPAQVATQDLRCSVCGGQVGMGLSFCPHCGGRLPWAGDAGGSGS
jgi:hypothetical protein